MKQGVILFAHGARDPQWSLPFERAATRTQQLMKHATVSLAYLEFMTPTLQEAGTSLVAQGCTQVHVVPLFLGAGGHVRRDLPLIIDQLKQRFPQTEWQLHPAAGESEAVIEALATTAVRAALGST